MMSVAIPPSLSGYEPLIEELRFTGRIFHQRGWSLATSSNYSIVAQRSPLELLITASGKHKGELAPTDFVRVDERGALAAESTEKSSAETLLHIAIARHRPAGAILHTHSVWGTLLSDVDYSGGAVVLEDYEMLKGLEHVATHRHSERVPIFDNTQDIPKLAEQVESWLASPDGERAHGFLIHRHGLYTWGNDVAAARRHVETFEFLFECRGRLLIAQSGGTR